MTKAHEGEGGRRVRTSPPIRTDESTEKLAVTLEKLGASDDVVRAARRGQSKR